MSMPFFLTKRINPTRFDRNEDYPKTTTPDKACVCFITDDNPKYVAYTRLACREMKKFIRPGTPVFVLTNAASLSIPEADRVFGIAGLLDDFEMHGISNGRFPDIIFGKFLLPLVPALAEFDRIVCYDPDAIAYGEEINDLLDFDFQGHDAMACGEVAMKNYLAELRTPLERHGLIGLPETEQFLRREADGDYCSGGLIVWNARAIRGHRSAFEHLIRFSVGNQAKCAYGLPEQSWLTICFDLLPISVYYDNSWEKTPENLPLIHYAGSMKKKLKKLCIEAGYMKENEEEEIK